MFEIFLNPQYQCVVVASAPCIKINTTFFCCPSFSKEKLKTLVSINQTENKDNVNYHLSYFLYWD